MLLPRWLAMTAEPRRGSRCPLSSHAAMTATTLVLGSSSVYRARMLERLGVPFTQESPDVDERAFDGLLAELGPEGLALRLARAKAASLARAGGSRQLLCADQVGVLEVEGAPPRLLHKPGTAPAWRSLALPAAHALEQGRAADEHGQAHARRPPAHDAPVPGAGAGRRAPSSTMAATGSRTRACACSNASSTTTRASSGCRSWRRRDLGRPGCCALGLSPRRQRDLGRVLREDDVRQHADAHQALERHASRSSQPDRAAASIIRYSPETWYAATGSWVCSRTAAMTSR